MNDTLARILADKRDHVARAKANRPLSALDAAVKAAPPARGFRAALSAARAAR